MSSRREPSDNYRDIIWINQGESIRLIRCKDNIQFIVQLRQSGRWRSRSYSTDLPTLFRDYPELDTGAVRNAIAIDANKRLVSSQRH
jgi:hypothetical protein